MDKRAEAVKRIYDLLIKGSDTEDFEMALAGAKAIRELDEAESIWL